MSQTSSSSATSDQSQDAGIDLGYVLGAFWDHRYLILALTLLTTLIGIGYAFTATPVYRSDALVQVESKSSGLAGPDMSGLLGEQEPQSNAHIEVLRSRMVLGQAVDQEDLTLRISPRGLPVLGNALARRGIARPAFAAGWASVWAGERLKVASLSVSPERLGKPLTLRALEDGRYALLDAEGQSLAEGKVGQPLEVDGDWVELRVSELTAAPGAEFTLVKTSRLAATRNLQSRFSVTPRSKESGVLELNLTGTDNRHIVQTLDTIGQIYLTQNIARQAAEAEQRLAFLEEQVPQVRQRLNEAEDRLNDFRATQDSIDLSFETENALNSLVEVESQLSELELTESEMSRRFTSNHPQYQSLMEKKQQLLNEKQRLEQRVDSLPDTQQKILRLTREVEVTQQIYVQLLNRMQELNIAKAGTVGNVRILDEAVIDGQIAPRTLRIVAVSLVIGLVLSIGIVLVRLVLNRGIEAPKQLEELGLPVYATVPLSEEQNKLSLRRVSRSSRKAQASIHGLLAQRSPADLSIEALRGLRTSLHFAMLEATDNRLMITGPAPSVGKSFISANLGAVCAQAGQKVLVIDADMRKGHLHHAFKGRSDQGLSEVLSGQLTLDEAIRSGQLEGLDYIARGTAPPNPSELLMQASFTRLLEEVSQRYDLVILDTPPILAVTDAAVIGKQVGTSLMVTRFAKNPAREVEMAKERMTTSGVTLKGAILNAMERKAATSYGYYGYYNYAYK